MANTETRPPSGMDHTVFWLLLHGATVALWRDCEENDGPPPGDQTQTAYEALGILHAQAHTYLENHPARHLVDTCPIDPSNSSADGIFLAPERRHE